MAKKEVKKYEKECIICGKKYRSSRIDSRYCSNANCRKKASLQGKTRKKEKEKEELKRRQEEEKRLKEKKAEEQRKEKEWKSFLKEYQELERVEREKKIHDTAISHIVYALLENAESREHRIREEQEKRQKAISTLERLRNKIFEMAQECKELYYYDLYLRTEFKSIKRKLMEYYDLKGDINGFYYLQHIYDSQGKLVKIIPWIKAIEADQDGMQIMCIAQMVAYW